MAAKSRDSENGTPKQLQEVVMTAAVGRSIEPAITTQLSEGKSKSNDTFPEDLGKEMRITATNKSQISTNGDLENYKVDDMAMGDEKPKENRRQQTSTAYTNRRSEILYAEVPPEKWKYSQLKMTLIIFFRLLLSGDVELNPGPREGRDRLSTDDLMVIQNELWDARSKWRNIGIQLQMKIADLEAIGEKHSNAPDNCFTDCITTWLRQTNPSPTWTALIKALRSSPVGFQEMAKRLERKFLQPFLTDNQVFKFPHIDEVAMNEQQKEVLKQRLMLETEDIQFKFCTLTCKFIDALEDQQVSLDRLVRYLEEPLGIELKHLSTIADVRCIIKENSSFYDYQFLAYMIGLAGTDSNKELLTKYQDSFAIYAQRRVFECPCQFGAKRNPNDTELHVKLDERYECKLDELKKFQSRLCVILKINVYVIRLFSVEKGCFQLLFVLPKDVQASTFPLSVKQENDLVLQRVCQLSCGDYLFSDLKVKIPSRDEDDDSTKYTELMKMDTQVPEVPSPQVLSPQNTDETDYDLNSGDSEDHSSEQSSVIAESETTNLSSILDPEANISAFLSKVHLTPGLMTMFTRRSRETQDKRIHLLQKQLQEVVVRAAVGGHVPPIETAISFCATQLSESRSNPKDILDTFPESVNLKVQKKYQCHSPLMIVCEDDREDIVDVLLKNEATVALKNKHGLTAVHIVCRRGNLNVLKKLLDKAKNQQVYCAKKGKTALPSDCEAVLLTRAKEGWYPVMYAVKEGHIEVVKECFDLVDHAITTKKKQTVLHIAARAEKLDCLKEIVPKVSEDLKTAIDKNGWNVLHHACASGNLEVLKWLIDNMKDVCSDMLKQKCKCDYTPLSTACEYRKEEIVRYLLTLPDVDVSTMTTEPTDHDSEARERTPLHIAAAHNSSSIVERLIEAKHPLTVKDKKGDTALHYAYRSESMDVVNLLEQHSPEIKSIVNNNKELPEKVKRKDVIPLEILRRGVYAVEIYKRVLKKGKQKIPRCNLLILGEERVGKTSLYRLLVRKDFDQDLQPTRGIDGNEVDIVDERSITMGDHDEWKEKLEENKEEQINKMYIDSVSETLYAELPTSEEDKKEVFEPDPVLSEDELMKKIEDIRRQLERICELTQKRVPSQYQAAHEAHIDRVPVHRERYSSAAPPKAPQDERQVQPRHPKPIESTKKHQDKPKSEDTGTIPRIYKDSENSHVYAESEEVSVSTLGIPPEETIQEASTPSISRQESQIFNKKLKAKKKETKDKVTEPIKLELRALDFAGQKQYRPMHHCFIIRRAMYLVVFNLQTMIEYIEAEESKASDTIVGGDATRTSPSPIEQLRYWLYSIHAHIFPPNEGDTMRRVCLVGTHKFPQGKRQISEDDIKKIDKRLKCEFKRDERCVNMFHYMGPSKAKQIFTCVENSVDGKKQEDREKSGALCLQKELKLVCNQLKFLDEDHPLIWLRFEHGLIKMRQNLVQKKHPLFVSVDEVLKLAESQGIDDAESQKLALNFFHDTGKLVYLERVPTLYLSKEEQKELAELIILDPVWLTRVMRAVVELDTDDYSGDRIPAVTLVEDGIASEELLMKIWAEFLGDTDDRDQAFHHLCTILKAYCLIYPLKKNAIPNLEDRPEEPPSPSDSFSHSESERRSAVAVLNKDFLIPCMLPETVERKDDSHLNWITFFFDFEKFLPEVLYHRFLCQLLADCHTSPQCYKSWSRFNNIHGCNWKIEPMRDVHRLRISVLSKDTTNLSQHIVYIHKNYLRRICAESEFIGLKYHGGPVAKCQCKEEDLKVLQYVSFCMEKKTSDEPKLILDCEHCLANQNVEQLLQLQVKDRNAYLSIKEIQSPLSSEDGKAQRILDDKHDKSNEPPVLRQAFKILVRKSDRWRNIGLLLDLDNRALGKIDAECRGIPDDCLREMLSLWLNQVNPQPTRKALAEAVEVYDPALAKQILN